MGLDMYLIQVPKKPEGKQVAYWRKLSELHSWMERYWRSQGKEGEFNCVSLLIDEDLMEALNEAAKDIPKNFAYAGGFFFGNPNETRELEEAIATINTAYDKAQQDGEELYYDSWW